MWCGLCGLCGFLIIKPQIALHHAVWCGAVQYYLRCGAVMPFCGRFWCGFCGLCSLCGLVNTPNCSIQFQQTNTSKHIQQRWQHNYSMEAMKIVTVVVVIETVIVRLGWSSHQQGRSITQTHMQGVMCVSNP